MPMANALVLAISKCHYAATAIMTAMVPHVVEEEDGVGAETGMHPLSMAASLGDVELTGMMLENKAHVDAVVSGYHVPNFWAVGFAFGKRKKFDVAMSDHPAPDVLCCLAK
eukprot:scaffold127280_cov20-Tisochrysis_lutea.AAC.1